METIRKKPNWFFTLVLSLIVSSLVISLSLFISNTTFTTPSSGNPNRHLFVESRLQISPVSDNPIPRIAYLISGSIGDGDSLKRILKALYHPLNQYVVHLDREASPQERLDLIDFVRNQSVFRDVGNVRVVVRSNLVTYRGSTMVSNTLHGAAILLKEGGQWDWFINLSASDYPLVTQDDFLHVLSTIPRDLNFIEHTSNIGWKEFQRARPVMIDPGFYSLQKSEVFWVPERRSVPTAFKLFTGSAWAMLSRPFIEYCIWGWDNLPRTALMYYANFLSSPEGYFHTVICNSKEFKNTVVNHDLHFISWDNPPRQHPHFLTVKDFDTMVVSNAPFARKFGRSDRVLDRIDSELLGSNSEGFVPGGWWSDKENASAAATSYFAANTTSLNPGPGADRLQRLINSLLSHEGFNKNCT